MKPIMLIVALALLASEICFAQSADERSFRTAIAVPSDTGRLDAIDKFIASNPSSVLISDAYVVRFNVLLSLHQDSAAFFSARQYLAAKDSSMLPVGYHFIAMELASRKEFLDSALAFADSAIARIKPGRKKNASFFFTKANILQAMNRDSDAEAALSYALSLLPASAANDPQYAPYFIRQSVIQSQTKPGIQGIVSLAAQFFITSQRFVTINLLDSLLSEKLRDSLRVPIVRDSLLTLEAGKYIATSKDTSFAKERAALDLSRDKILRDTAILYATQAYHEVQNRSIGNQVYAAGALGIVLYNFGMYQAAEPYLKQAFDFVSPYETEILVTYGEDEAKLGKKQEAFQGFLKGALIGRTFPEMSQLIALQNELYPGTSLDSIITTARYREMEFPVEKYEPDEIDRNHKVVLAELFTGSECRSCQATDIAFDKLIQRFDRVFLTVLEYHLSIPKLDPMENADADSRSSFYSVSSVPSVFIDGRQVKASGGTLLATKNEFLLYSDVIRKDLSATADASITLRAFKRHGRIRINVSAKIHRFKKSYKLHLVLVENDVAYSGSNFISDHKFVVRKIIGLPKGISFDKKGKANVRNTVDISSVESELKKYFDSSEEERQGNEQEMKEVSSMISLRRLYVAAFIQDDSTHEVLQSRFVMVR
jgi:tetratricopeptide (TPR) repeat protein